MVMRTDNGARILLDQKSHRINRPWSRRFFGRRGIPVGADIAGQPEPRTIGTGTTSRRTCAVGRGDHWHGGIFSRRLLHPKITAMSEQDILSAIRFDTAGLVPAIAQQHDTGEVLMLAWMNRTQCWKPCHTARLLLQPQSQCTMAQGRNLGPGAATEGAARRLRRRHAAAVGEPGGCCLPHWPPQLLLPCHTRREAGGDRRAAGLTCNLVPGHHHD